jgi:hypothetical protein
VVADSAGNAASCGYYGIPHLNGAEYHRGGHEMAVDADPFTIFLHFQGTMQRPNRPTLKNNTLFYFGYSCVTFMPISR